MGISNDIIDMKGFVIYNDDKHHMATLAAAIPDTADDTLYDWGGEENLNNYLPQLREEIAELNTAGLTITCENLVTGDCPDIIGWENYDANPETHDAHDPTEEELQKLKEILDKYNYKNERLFEDRFVQVG